jgi:hypothetical protein
MYLGRFGWRRVIVLFVSSFVRAKSYTEDILMAADSMVISSLRWYNAKNSTESKTGKKEVTGCLV